MHLLSVLLLLFALLCQVTALGTVTGLYGKTVSIPCNYGAIKAADIMMMKWKYNKGDAQFGDLLVKQKDQNVSISATNDYRGRVNMDANFTLLLSEAKLTDERTFTCMVVAGADIHEFPVTVHIYKSPAGVEISDEAKELEFGKLTKLGKCVARDANPAANITWLRNNKPLVADGKGIIIKNSVDGDSVTGLSTTTSTLEYSAEKADNEAQFTCRADHPLGNKLVSSPVTFTITYSTEHIDLQVIPQNRLVEGDNLTLKCVADGNPAPTSFMFDLKGNAVKVEKGNVYTLTNISRNTSGVYKCSLIDNPSMEASRNITVNYLDINLSPSGKIVKRAGETLDITLQINSSTTSKVHWTKDFKQSSEPKFTKLAYSDSGFYECKVTMENLERTASFELVVTGAPKIKGLKEINEDGQQKILICEVEGSPKPAVSWSINGTLLNETSFPNGNIEHKIAVVPSANLTVSCTVSNEFGTDTKLIVVSPLFEEVRMDKQDEAKNGDKTLLVVGVVVGLVIAAVVIGLAYWLYMKKSKQGSWKTGEKENGSLEEEKKLEENSQKAEV
ncbi:activated leukocyte cell adhesion molecule b [Austrofundulus limnaeus]|uniref:Activated leukocyte cell adhesion molecule b n=1 Tax=Austrofundulus limnaeus TaxID=52670 RepID=A0A2I4BJC7_AUSLI|nr:PREDICTED: CD166 antigen homolog A-like [Austrofundulus limnaeus]